MVATASRTGVLLRRCFLRNKLRSLNTFLGAHWASKKNPAHWREHREWLFILRSTEGLGFPLHHGEHKRRVRIWRVMTKAERPWDDENLYGGSVKALNDALVDLEWLKDDAPRWRELNLFQIRAFPDAPKGTRLVVEIFELE